MKIIILLYIIIITLFANSTKLYKTCHPIIYSEFQHSIHTIHKKSSPKLDKVHNTVEFTLSKEKR